MPSRSWLACTAPFVLFAAGCSSLADPGEREEREGRDKQHPLGVMQRQQARLSADGSIPAGAVLRAVQDRRNAVQAQAALDGPGAGIAWNWLGPGNVGGRIRSIVIHPTIHSRMWVGSVGGGIWRTDDAGVSWYPQNDFLATLPVSCLVMDPNNPDRLLAGTGEGFFDAVQGSSNTAILQGAGIFESTDAGATWNHVAATATPAWQFVNRLAFSPVQPSLVLAATGSGIWRSVDGGATWSQVTTARTMDIDCHPADASKAVAGRADGLAQYSIDGGLTWQTAIGPLNSTRVELAYARSNPSIVYCTAADAAWRVKVWRSGDGGQQYVQRTTDSGVSTYSLYLNTLWVDPTNADRIAFGAVSMYRSIDGGVTRTTITTGGHSDYHIVVEHPLYDGTTNRRVYTGNDGGIHTRTDLLSGSWQELNNNLGITQFYGAAVNPASGRVLAGAQDNGTSRFTGDPQNWNYNVIGGDGGFCAADQNDPNYFYGEYQRLMIQRSTNGGSSFGSVTSGLTDSGSSTNSNFIPYFMLDPNDQNRMLACGRSLWRSNSIKGTPGWTVIKPGRSCSALTGGGPAQAHFQDNAPCNISTCAVALGNSDVIWVGHNDGEVYRTANGTAASPTWTLVDGVGGQLPDRWISSFSIDPTDPRRVYVSIMGYHRDNVWRTSDAGATWTQITGSGAFALPTAPVSWVSRHPRLPGWLYAATDVGLYTSTDDGTTWTAVTDGPGAVAMDQLVWRDDRRLLVVTHGLGVWEATIAAATATPVAGGCPPSAPVLNAGPPVLGATELWTMTGAPAGALVLFGYSFGPPANVAIGACTVQLDLPNSAPYAAGLTDGNGAWVYGLPIPLLPALAGAEVTAQALALQNGGALLGLGELSTGVQLVLGF